MSVHLAAGLNDADMVWLMSLGRFQRLSAGQRLITAGRPINDLFFVLSGGLDVVREDGTRVATIGEGEVVGEMSFVGEEVPSVSVLAAQSGEVFVAPRGLILERLEREPAIGMRFYRALALCLASRLRETTDAVGVAVLDCMTGTETAAVTGRFRRLLGSLTGTAN